MSALEEYCKRIIDGNINACRRIKQVCALLLDKLQNPSKYKPYVFEDQHVYDVIRQVYEQKLSLIPVLDHKNHYLGSITLQCLVKYFARLAAVDNPGGIIVLEMGIRDYSLSEIARHVTGAHWSGPRFFGVTGRG